MDEGINLAVYLGLLALTGLTLAASHFGQEGRLLVVSIAVIIASMKAGLIGFYYMGLRHEKPIIYGMIAIGALAVLALFVGILPDMTFQRL
jgi:caa(3)-type oxidase subunit IV